MRKLLFDQFEFDSSSSEEFLEIHIAAKVVQGVRQFHDVKDFVEASAGIRSIQELTACPFADWAIYSPVREYLRRFANVEVPDPCGWGTYILHQDDLEWDGVFETPDKFIRYHWYSTA